MSEQALIRDLKEFMKRTPIGPAISGFRAWAHAPGNQRDIFRDFLSTRAEVKYLRNAQVTTDSTKKVLIASLTTDIYPIKLEAMLASGLRISGWSPVVLVSRVHTWAKSYFQAYGLREFVYWEDHALTAEERRECVRDADTFFKKEITFRDVKTWTYQGAWIGPQVLSAISRNNHLGAPNVRDPVIRAEMQMMLPRTLENVVQAKKLIEALKPNLALINEANGPVMGPIVDMAVSSGISVIQHTQPSRDDALVLKRLVPETRRIHPSSLTRATLSLAMSSPWTEKQETELAEEFGFRYSGKWYLQNRNQQYVKDLPISDIHRKLDLDRTKKVAVLFSHVLWDANLFYGDDLFEDYGEWFVETVKAACANPKLNWIIKMHPANAWKRARDSATGELAETILIRENIGALPAHVKLLHPESEINTRALFDLCDYGITVRGTAGVELPCFGKPTLTAGTGRYSGLGFTVDSNTREEYLKRLASLETQSPMTVEDILLAKRHAHTVFRIRPWRMKSFKSVFNYPKQGRHPLDQNLLSQTAAVDEINRNGDLKNWANWASDLKNIDYLDFSEN